MNSLTSIIIASFILVSTAICAQEAHISPNLNALVKLAIQQDIEHFRLQTRLSTGSTRKAEENILGIKYTLIGTKMGPGWDIGFTLECSDKEIEKYFKDKLNTK